MIDKVMITIADVIQGTSSFIEGIFGRQPNLAELQKRVESLQEDADRLAEVFRQQNAQIEQMLIHYGTLKFYQLYQKTALKKALQDELVCQYAALDYLTILIDTAESGAKMSHENLDFYRMYCGMFADGQIDADELVTLRPIMLQRHAREVEGLRPCSFGFVFDRIKRYEYRSA